jgi:hypothetical protein
MSKVVELKSANSKKHAGETAINADEKIGSLFEPDTLLSAQYFETLRRKTLLEPEKRLMLAVLEDAINCFQDHLFAQGGRGKRLFAEAEEWILEKDGDWTFSFDSICQMLGFNPEYVRWGLLKWKEKNLSKLPDARVWERKKMAG